MGIEDPNIHSLRPIKYDYGIIRAKIKIVHREDSENFRCPDILPSYYPVVQRLIYETYLENQQAKVSILMAHLREIFLDIKRMTPEDTFRDGVAYKVVGVDSEKQTDAIFKNDGTILFAPSECGPNQIETDGKKKQTLNGEAEEHTETV
ncbi:hypothetical protein NPIL_196831 [Nephila pilipes]|uniref:Uncharacterized protein n=1 Tax=Nephila pilipes TaxID=299642 RepID=A0A8X6N8I2_NEPPI|nr:hypothetical protein NPIL_196831 [Nephila pilipes]